MNRLNQVGTSIMVKILSSRAKTRDPVLTTAFYKYLRCALNPGSRAGMTNNQAKMTNTKAKMTNN
jgi:hypothetical protein